MHFSAMGIAPEVYWCYRSQNEKVIYDRVLIEDSGIGINREKNTESKIRNNQGTIQFGSIYYQYKMKKYKGTFGLFCHIRL